MNLLKPIPAADFELLDKRRPDGLLMWRETGMRRQFELRAVRYYECTLCGKLVSHGSEARHERHPEHVRLLAELTELAKRRAG